MTPVSRCGSLKLNYGGNSESRFYNLYGSNRQKNFFKPHINVIGLSYRQSSEDLKNQTKRSPTGMCFEEKEHDLSQDVDSDEISNYIGHFGKWQLIWTFFLSLFQIPPTFQMFAFVFQTASKDFWCARPASLPNLKVTKWKNLTQSTNSCYVWDVDFNEMEETTLQKLFSESLASPNTMNYTSCSDFEFSRDDGDAMTLIEEFQLVCSRGSVLSVVEMCFLAGAAIGSVSSGWISDRFGRKHTLMGFALIQTLFGTALTFTNSLALYMTLRVIIGFASMTVAVVSFVLVVELVSGRWRTIVGILNILPVAVSYVLMASIAYFIRDWRTLQLTISLPWVPLLFIWYCVPESPRWLLARGRLDELFPIVERAARMNHRTLQVNYKKSLEAVAPIKTGTKNLQFCQVNETLENLEKSDTKSLPSNPLIVVFGRRYCRTTCLTLIVWLTLIIVYFGLTLHLSNLGGNIYLNTIIAGTVESVSICLSIFVVLRLGIRRNLMIYMLIPGICCLAANIVPKGENSQIVVIALALIAKCVIGANNAIVPTFTAMQYPTTVRNFGLGMGNLAAGVALVLVPYMWLLEHIDPLMPMSIMGICGLVGTLALYFMSDVEE